MTGNSVHGTVYQITICRQPFSLGTSSTNLKEATPLVWNQPPDERDQLKTLRTTGRHSSDLLQAVLDALSKHASR